jgi:hypothetical protein
MLKRTQVFNAKKSDVLGLIIPSLVSVRVLLNEFGQSMRGLYSLRSCLKVSPCNKVELLSGINLAVFHLF